MLSVSINDYPFEVSREENDGVSYFVVSFPDVLYAGGAAETQEEAIQLAKESLKLTLEEMESNGEALPKPTIRHLEDEVSGRITFRMPKSLHRRLLARSKRDGVSANVTIQIALSEYLSREDVITEMKQKTQGSSWSFIPLSKKTDELIRAINVEVRLMHDKENVENDFAPILPQYPSKEHRTA